MGRDVLDVDIQQLSCIKLMDRQYVKYVKERSLRENKMEIEAKDIDEFLIEKPTCCSKEMHRMEVYSVLDNSVGGFQWICFECGAYLKVEDGQYDEEVVENYKENLR